MTAEADVRLHGRGISTSFSPRERASGVSFPRCPRGLQGSISALSVPPSLLSSASSPCRLGREETEDFSPLQQTHFSERKGPPSRLEVGAHERRLSCRRLTTIIWFCLTPTHKSRHPLTCSLLVVEASSFLPLLLGRSRGRLAFVAFAATPKIPTENEWASRSAFWYGTALRRLIRRGRERRPSEEESRRVASSSASLSTTCGANLDSLQGLSPLPFPLSHSPHVALSARACIPREGKRLERRTTAQGQKFL